MPRLVLISVWISVSLLCTAIAGDGRSPKRSNTTTTATPSTDTHEKDEKTPEKVNLKQEPQDNQNSGDRTEPPLNSGTDSQEKQRGFPSRMRVVIENTGTGRSRSRRNYGRVSVRRRTTRKRDTGDTNKANNNSPKAVNDKRKSDTAKKDST